VRPALAAGVGLARPGGIREARSLADVRVIGEDVVSEGQDIVERLTARIGLPLSASGPSVAPDEVNVPMIRHWVDAFDDRNPVYLDAGFAATTRFGGIVAPPAMLQTWTMGRPRLEGIAARGGAADEIDADSPLGILADAGFGATRATNSELEFLRYLHPGDRLVGRTVLEAVSEQKTTGLGVGHFITWVTSYTDQHDAEVGRQRFRIFRFRPGAPPPSDAASPSRPATAGTATTEEAPTGAVLPPRELDLTATVVVAGAIASRDFMPVHHDRSYAQSQGAPDIFLNILSTTGHISRYLTDWAGPHAAVRGIAIRLGAPATAGSVLRLTGAVTSERIDGGERIVEVAIRATAALGDHATGTATLALPAG
jgi:uncharacterized protein